MHLHHSSLLFAALPSIVAAVGKTVQLDYATYSGGVSGQDSLISFWHGIQYAAPPVKELRFAAPQEPINQTSIVSAIDQKPVCLGYPGTSDYDDTKYSEDCLYLDVVAPKNATTDDKLPVFFYIQGGGLASLGPTYSAGKLIAASGYNMIVVQAIYRLGPYGFLGGQQILDDKTASANNGIKDQRKALEWVQRHIHKFGGDAGHVTLGGASAGGQSAMMQLIAYGGRDDGLFHAAAIQSASLPPIYTVAQSQFEFDTLLNRTGCHDLDCLRNLDARKLQPHNHGIAFPNRPGQPKYTYNPMVDNDLLRDYPLALIQNGTYVKVPLLIGDDENEGTVFTPLDTQDYAAGDVFLQNNLPLLTGAMLNQTHKLWNVTDFPQTFANNSKAGKYWRQLSAVYGDLRYTCPNLLNAEVFANASQNTWSYLYNVTTPEDEASGYGSRHTSEIALIWNNTVPSGSPRLAEVPIVQGYWTSFIKHFNPNTAAFKGAPAWDKYSYALPRRMRLRTGANELQMVNSVVKSRCAYWRSIGLEIGQ